MLEATTIQTRNLLSNVDLHTAASSQAKNHGARNAVDGLQGTSWRFEPGDERPSLFIQLSKPQRADTLSLSQAAAAREHLGKLARILRINVYVNRSSKPMEVTLDPDELEPTMIPLGRSLRIKRIRIEVLATAPGSNKVQRGGFAEVVLLHEKEKRR